MYYFTPNHVVFVISQLFDERRKKECCGIVNSIENLPVEEREYRQGQFFRDLGLAQEAENSSVLDRFRYFS